MAKLKATPKNFAEAFEIVRNAKGGSARLGNNTYIEFVHPELAEGFIGIRLHDTYIVRFHRDGRVTLRTGGYRTATTKERINQFVTGRVRQKDYAWHYIQPDGKERFFLEGINVGGGRVWREL